MDLFRDTHIDFMKYRKIWIVVSLAVLVAGLIAIFYHGKLNVGIDFAGGTQLTIKFQEQPDVDRLRTLVAQAGFEDAQIQRFGDEDAHEVMIKTPLVEGGEEGSREQIVQALAAEYGGEGGQGLDLNEAGAPAISSLLTQADPEGLREPGADDFAAAEAGSHYAGVAEAILEARREVGLFNAWEEIGRVPGVTPNVLSTLRSQAHLSDFAVLAVENVGPLIGQELRRRGILAVVLSLVGMLIYIWIRFELRYGVGALMATIHDVLICLGIYAWAGFEFNLTTIAAFLTLVGYSVNDTVVVFDRVRENLQKNRRLPLVDIMNQSLNQTLSRTVLTSGTTLLAVGTLLLYGGDVLRGFAFVLTIGILVGTYSSIYIASPFALLWEQVFGAEARQKKSSAKAA